MGEAAERGCGVGEKVAPVAICGVGCETPISQGKTECGDGGPRRSLVGDNPKHDSGS